MLLGTRWPVIIAWCIKTLEVCAANKLRSLINKYKNINWRYSPETYKLEPDMYLGVVINTSVCTNVNAAN